MPLDEDGIPVLTADPNALQDVTEAIRATLQNVNRIVADNQQSVKNSLKNLEVFTQALARNSDLVGELDTLPPEARDTPPAPKAGPPQTKKSGGPVASGPGGEAGVPVGGAAGLGSGTGIGVEGGVLGANAPWYLVQLRDKIAANWRPPATVGRPGEMRAAFHFRVAPDGSVEALEAAGSSNHFQYDIAARRAIEMSSPLPPLPDELGAGSIGITLTFTQVY